MATFLLKTEPSTFSFADMQRDKRCTWDGVANPAALGHLRTMREGDEALIYHTGDEKRIVGLARVVKAPYADPKQPGTTPDGKPKFAVVDLVPVKAAACDGATLAAIKADPRFKDFALVRLSRLSVMPVPSALDKALRKLAGL